MKYYEVYLDTIVSKSVTPLTEEEFYKDCESICFECGRTLGLKKIHDGEIPNMKGHGVYMDFEGRGHWGYHCDQFQPTDGEDCSFK